MSQVLVSALRVVRMFSFRSVVIVGSSIPDPLPKHPEDEPLRIERHELRIWKQLARRNDLPLTRFGDTGIWSPHQPDQGGGGGAPPARIRLPVGDEQVFFRAKGTEYRQLAKRALADVPTGLPRCWGLDSIRRAAEGSGGVDGASGWVARDTNIHIEATARTVLAYLSEVGRLSEIAPTVERKSPWQQESFLS